MSFHDSASAKEVEFAYQTRLVVYKFLGLVPTRSVNENESDRADENIDKIDTISEDLPYELSSLPQVSLIEKLKDSEEHYAKNKSVCDELMRKVKRVSSDSPKSEKQRKSRIKYSSQKLYPEDLHNCLLQEIRLNGGLNAEVLDENLRQMTVIKKSRNVKVIIDSSKQQQRESFELSPIPNFTIAQMDGHSDTLSFDGSSGKVGSSKEESPDPEDIFREQPMGGSSNLRYSMPEWSFKAVHQSLGRQISSVSGDSRRCSTYVDVNDVDDMTLRSFRTLPRTALPLKREISKAISQLESDFNDQMQTFQRHSGEVLPLGDSRSSSGVTTPLSDSSLVSQVADRLRAIGDRLNEREPTIEDAICELLQNYYVYEEYFKEALRDTTQLLLSGIDSGWSKVAMLLMVGQNLLMRLFETGSTQLTTVAEMTAVLLEQQMGSFILSSGGWNGVTDLDLLEQPLDLNPNEMFECNGNGEDVSVEGEKVETNYDDEEAIRNIGEGDKLDGMPLRNRASSKDDLTPDSTVNVSTTDSDTTEFKLTITSSDGKMKQNSTRELISASGGLKNGTSSSSDDCGRSNSLRSTVEFDSSTESDGGPVGKSGSFSSVGEGLRNGRTGKATTDSEGPRTDVRYDASNQNSNTSGQSAFSIDSETAKTLFKISVFLGGIFLIWRVLKNRR